MNDDQNPMSGDQPLVPSSDAPTTRPAPETKPAEGSEAVPPSESAEA